jgi:hypothetical protein
MLLQIIADDELGPAGPESIKLRILLKHAALGGVIELHD